MIKSNLLVQKLQTTIFIIILLRAGTFIPIPHVEQTQINSSLSSSLLFQIINNTENPRLGIFSLGIIPYINASILIQLLTGIVPIFERLQKEEGENGRKKLKQYTRFLTLIFALEQSISVALNTRSTMFEWNLQIGLDIILALTTGAMVTLWLSERISEHGVGNGPSIVIATSIISSLPTDLQGLKEFNTISLSQILLSIALIAGIIFIQESVRRIPLVSAKQLFSQTKDGNSAYLPLRINQGGIMPIIFTSTIINYIATVLNFLSRIIPSTFLFIDLNQVSLVFPILIILKFLLILGFTFFYSTLILNPKEISKELNKMAVTIPNIRPGGQTEQFLNQTSKRLGTLGAVFLALLIIIPNLKNSTNIGITSFLILVSIIIETDRQILTLWINRKYEGSLY